MPVQMRRGQPNRRANAATARFIPLLLIGIIGYSAWVVTDLVAIDYLIKPKPSLLVRRRPGTAAAILTIFYFLLAILLICYGRLIQTIITNPGLLPRGPQWYVEQERNGKSRDRQDSSEKEHGDSDSGYGYGKLKTKRQPDEDAYRVQDFWHKNVFICSFDGRPPYCSRCYNFKLDRVHHCSELDRCVLKMDHFCPWVGGIVSENSFKYFIQFTFWTALFTLTTLVFMAYFFAERRSREDFINVHWILVIAFAALFLIFGAGMCASSLQFALLNTTTIENINRRSHIWFVAVHLSETVLQKYNASNRTDLRLITYPRPPGEQLEMLQQQGVNVSTSVQSFANPTEPTPPPAAHTPSAPLSDPTEQPSSNPAPPLVRTFAILETKPGRSPFFVDYWTNFREVLGYTIFDWFFPLRPSPCTNHDDPHSMYKLGDVVYKLKKEAGILGDEEMSRRRSKRRKKRRRRGSNVDEEQRNV